MYTETDLVKLHDKNITLYSPRPGGIVRGQIPPVFAGRTPDVDFPVQGENASMPIRSLPGITT
ncbi:MAG: hypothetical protein LBQ51_02495 [Desulfovibrio sp.]|nr:hypothetical protein [Desulfovibrio sp.]